MSTGAAPEPPGGFPVRQRGTFSPRVCHTGGVPAAAAADFTNATPSTSETYIAEVFIPGAMRVNGVAVFNGSDVTGNTAVALADADGTIVGSSAATAGSGTDAYQRIPLSTPVEVPRAGVYYVLRQQSSATARINCHAVGNFGAAKKTGETFGTFTAITPPLSFTADLGPVASLY